MKLGKTVLVALAIVAAFLYQILANAAPAYLPKFSCVVFWGAIVLPLTIVTILVSVLQSKNTNSQNVSLTEPKSKQSSKVAQQLKTNQPLQQQSPFRSTQAERNEEHVLPRNSSQLQVVEVGQPTLEHPALLCFALDVSDTMIDSAIDHTVKTVKHWANIKTVLDRLLYLGTAFVQDPETHRVLPLYHTIAYGFGFTERAHLLGISKKPGGAVRDLLDDSSLPALPSVAQLTDQWDKYKEHFTSKKYTLDVLGSTPLCQALTTIRDRIQAELAKKSFVLPVLLLIVSDGISTDGDPLPLISELHKMGVLTLCCYLGEQNILDAKQLYALEDNQWSDGAKCMFRMASVLRRDNYITRAMYDYLENAGWHPREGVRLFAQVNQSEALDNFLKILLSGFLQERQV